MQNESIKLFRVDVPGDKVQKYASSSVSGGGGYVTSVNGTTYGQNQAITTTINHHVDRDILVKNLATGKEIQLNIVGTTLPVQHGHILRIASDNTTDCWEGLANETTGQCDYGNGQVNPKAEQYYLATGSHVIFLAIGLVILLVNWLVRPLALNILLTTTPTKLFDARIPNVLPRVLIVILAGIVAMVLSLVAFSFIAIDTKEHSFFTKLLTVVGLIVSFVYFVKPFRELFKTAAELVKQRSAWLEKCVERSALI